MRRILVVDDSTMMRAVYEHMLSRIGECAVTFANDGLEALKLIVTEEPDLLILDINMPVMNGLSVLARLRADGRLERICVVLATTEGRNEDIERGLAAGARDYISKPFRGPDLAKVIERLLPAGATGAPGRP